jgi:hypothetical protein
VNMDQAAITPDEIAGMTLSDAAVPVAMLLGGVPVLTCLVITAARYVASGTF